VDVSGLELDCDVDNIPLWSSLVISNDFDTFSTDFKAFSIQQVTVGTEDLVFDSLKFQNNFRTTDLIANTNAALQPAVPIFTFNNTDVGTATRITQFSTGRACNLLLTQDIRVELKDAANSAITANAGVWLTETDDGNRVEPVGRTGFGWTTVQAYDIEVDGTGLCEDNIRTGIKRIDTSDVTTQSYFGVSSSDDFVIYAYGYGYNPTSRTEILRGNGGLDVTWNLVTDTSITQTNRTTVDAYTEIDTLDRLYDRYNSWHVDNFATAYPSIGVRKLSGNGSDLDCGSANIVVDGTAASAFAVDTGTDTITIKASVLSAGTTFTGITTTGTISFANGAAASATLVYTDTTGTSVPITVGGVRDGSKVRVVRTDTSAELAIGTAGASGFATRVTWSTDLPIRADTAYVSGLDAEAEASALGTLTNAGAALTIVQTPCAIYEGNGIDGSAVTGLTLDAPNIEIDADEADNAMTVQQIYAWYKNELMTDAGIRTLFGAITAENAHKYRVNTAVVPLKIDQKDLVNSLVLSGGLMYRDDGASIRLAGSGVIEFVVEDVYESQAAETALAAIKAKTDSLTFTVAGQVDANVESMNTAEVIGTGTTGDAWRGVGVSP